MSDAPLRIAVVGHTNTGKTSLLRTLLRNAEFGEVSDRPATTRHVEGAAILVDGREVMHLFDTPGLEDSSGLHAHLSELRGSGRADGLESIRQFLAGDEASGVFSQEAKALRQVLAADAALYVIDARDPVLGKHRDELEILAWCAKPVVPVLNFIAGEGARSAEWREHLARIGLHALAEFDTVVFDSQSEERLYEKMRTLLDQHRGALDGLISHRRRERARLIRASARVIAELLLDTAAYTRWAPASQAAQVAESVDWMKDELRRREKRCAKTLIELHRFDPNDAEVVELSTAASGESPDLFSPEALRQFGLSAGRGAAIGALAGLAADVMVGGMSLGAATAAGAGIGALVESMRTQGRSWIRRVQGDVPIRCDDATIRLLALRQIALCRALLTRGHASQAPVDKGLAASIKTLAREATSARLPRAIADARIHPGWSTLSNEGAFAVAASLQRQSALDELAELIEAKLSQPSGQPWRFP